LALGRGELGEYERVEQREGFTGLPIGERGEGGGGDFTDDVVERSLGGVADLGTEEDGAGFERGIEGGWAVDGAGDFAGEGAVGFAGAGVGEVLGFEGFDFRAGEEGEFTEILADFGVLGVDEKLVEFVRAGFLGIEPDGAALGFAEFTAVGFGDEREGETPGEEPDFFADEVGAGGDVAPLLGAADLEFAVEDLAEVAKIVGLKQLVAELGETNAGFAAEAGFRCPWRSCCRGRNVCRRRGGNRGS
jgi:hypothetical protein